jgi:5-oxoprolinase (ATP-hydrolysing) subunit C
MTGLIEVVQPGFGSTVQDSGRRGHRHEGMPQSGWLDATLAQAANALVGNIGGEAVLELRGMGTELRVQAGPVRVVLAGAVAAKWLRVDGAPATLSAWQSATLQTGDRMQLGMAETGCAYLAFSGGCSLPPALGSRSSYGRAGLPGVLGRALRPGDVLPCSQWRSPDPKEWRTPSPWTLPDRPIRVMLGPQQDHFTAEAVAAFLNEEWLVTAEQDRMGMRLRGAPLQHLSAATADIVSDAVAPGTIQVPANGQPIVLLADSQTVGGYPKIATVITADLPRLAHLRPGTALRFQAVNGVEAKQALSNQSQAWKRWLATREAFVPPGFIDHEALYANNLISGMLCAEI